MKALGYTDALAVTGTGWPIEEVRRRVSHSVTMIVDWLQSNYLQVAPRKSDAIILNKPRKIKGLSLNIMGMQITTQGIISFLGAHFNRNLRI